MTRDQSEPRFRDSRTDTVQKAELPDRCEHRLLVHQLLGLPEGGLALVPIGVRRLLPEEPVDVWIATVDIRAAGRHECLHARRGVAERSAAGLHDIFQLLLTELREEGRA